MTLIFNVVSLLDLVIVVFTLKKKNHKNETNNIGLSKKKKSLKFNETKGNRINPIQYKLIF